MVLEGDETLGAEGGGRAAAPAPDGGGGLFMGTTNNRLGFEWVAVSKRRLYAGAALLVLAASACVGLYLRLPHDGGAGGRELHPAAARFNLVEGEVRVVRGETREVVRAGAVMAVRPGDTVETLDAARAVITLADGSTLEVSPNSLVTISENAGAREGTASRVRVALGRGRLEVSTEEQPAESSNTVETRLTKNRLAARTEASFDVFDNSSEEVRVGAGSVVSEMPAGRTTIGPEEHLALGRGGEVRRREPLLDAPVLYDPPHAARVVAREREQMSVTLQWTRPLARLSVTYRVEVASSPFFVAPGLLFEREGLASTRLVLTDLPPGNYFWRARSISEAGQASAWGGPQRFTILTDSAEAR